MTFHDRHSSVELPRTIRAGAGRAMAGTRIVSPRKVRR